MKSSVWVAKRGLYYLKDPVCLDFFSCSFYPKDHWTLKTGYFEDPTPAI